MAADGGVGGGRLEDGGRGGGCTGRCAVLLMEMDVGSKLSPEQLPRWREKERERGRKGGDPFLLSFLQREGAESSRFDVRELQRGQDGRKREREREKT